VIDSKEKTLDTLAVAHKIVDVLEDKKGEDILLLDIREVGSLADYFVICSGDNERQIRTIYEDIEQSLKKESEITHHNEGAIDSGWLLLDYGDVIVHIFSEEEREYYQLDELWRDARPVIRIQ